MANLKTEIVTLDLQVIPTSSPLSSALSVSESRSTSSGTPNSSPSQLLAIALFSSQAGNRDSSNRPSTSQVLKTWPETFQVPWEQMPQEIRSAILSGKRPKPTERRQMVRILVDEMRRYEANPTRSQCLTVIRNIIRQYPKSFADMTADWSLLGCGYTSLLIQVKNRIENVNRSGNYAHHRASRSSSTYKRGPTDTYGCTRFQPELPPEETNETVEQNRQRLVEIYRQEGAGGVERAELLMAHFGEDLTGLVLLTNVSATAADVETTLTLPASPRLILLGGTGRFIGINPERGTKAIRGKVVCKKTGVIVQKKSATVNTHVSTLLKNLLDFESD
ncbi:hypothetical protein JOQ06_011789 [Pogonophryne albipinna]|uniref:Uncharacterized protein n=1 Tax=Pogonophryne albipinna TaxID=1090488 RepID=A0AAD6FQT0_9TELE|nr:hypothetical protein JOQ06_011789 [Pogonophryne albipinna]